MLVVRGLTVAVDKLHIWLPVVIYLRVSYVQLKPGHWLAADVDVI